MKTKAVRLHGAGELQQILQFDKFGVNFNIVRLHLRYLISYFPMFWDVSCETTDLHN